MESDATRRGWRKQRSDLICARIGFFGPPGNLADIIVQKYGHVADADATPRSVQRRKPAEDDGCWQKMKFCPKFDPEILGSASSTPGIAVQTYGQVAYTAAAHSGGPDLGQAEDGGRWRRKAKPGG